MSLQKVKSHLDEDRQKKIAIKSDQFISRLCPKWLKIWLFLQVFIGMQTGLSANKLWAQSEKLTFQHFIANEGLSHNSVNCILQDHEGYLWIGTQDGLNRQNLN